MNILSGHISPETAFMVNDYPYGFRLRCKIRYWLESSPNKGVRFCSQTTNPKRGDVWNKPKASTYSRFGGCMFTDENGHVQWTGISEYSDLQEMIDWKKTYFEGLPPEFKPIFDKWLAMKMKFNEQKARGEISMVMTETLPGGQINQTKTVLQPEIIK